MPEDLELIGQGQRHDPSGTGVSPYLHGNGGLFNAVQCADTRVMSAIISPTQGLMTELPVINGEHGTEPNSTGGVDSEASIALTGITSGDLDNWDNQPTGDCVDGPVGGLLKLGAYVNPYARIRGSTREVSMVRAGRTATFCEPMTLSLINQPNGFGGIGQPSSQPTLLNALNNEIATRIFESLHSMQRMFSRRMWIGSPSNNSGERRDIWGFEGQINTNTHKDKTSSSIMTALNSDVKPFGYDFVEGSGRDIVEYMEEVDFQTSFNAEKMGLDDYDYWIVMRSSAWRKISANWPIRESFEALRLIRQYGANSNSSLSFDARSILDARNAIRRGMVLPLNGRDRRVILDSSIPEQSIKTTGLLKAGQYASDIYGIPRVVRGNIPVTFWKYFNHNNGQEMAIARLAGESTFTSDNGLFRWYINAKNGCVKINWEFSPKLVVLTPQLAWRITNVAYEPLQHEREAYPDSDYFLNGGVTNSTVQKFYTGWDDAPVEL